MNAHMRNSKHNYNPHLHYSVRKPANHPRSDVINLMQDVINSTHINVQSKNRCASAESSTTCSGRVSADLNTSEPSTLLIKHRNQSSALKSDNLSIILKLKGSGRRVDVSGDAGRHIGSRDRDAGRCIDSSDRHDSNAKPISVNNEAIQISGGLHVHDYGVPCGLKVQDNLLVCCMCGDAGIAEFLFLCSKCSHRHQHIYCSRSYPDMNEEASICNWCLHEEESMISSVTKACDHAIANKSVRATASPNVELPRATASLALRGTQCQLGNHVSEDEKMMVKKGHSKAFEYLLLVAAQSLPQQTQAIGDANMDANTKVRQDNHTPSTTSPPVVGKDNRNSDIIKANVTPLVNIENVGPQAGKPNSNLNNNRLSLSLTTTQNMRIHSPVKISIDHKSMDVSRFIGGSIPKRQRCNKGIGASLKCRKKGLQLSPSRPNYRRYKLLADVVC